MSKIGTFAREATGFVGRIHTFTLYREITLVPAEPSEAENAPDYRVHVGDDQGPEIGAGWKRTGERAGEYVAIILDDPAFLAPIRAHLFRDEEHGDAWSLHWSRTPRNAERG
ncbi:hypothetical protein BJF93_23135 [Xaviernesmea oryzae]|uniref:DUF736 domain-containing protein n=1 Tax=Xaviernesmea oryzae TaxID=464029 RepID=A0A1Q9AU29_9HYPH|nr:DUF736 domain-containing protein [Xaviernesmea oryzae]OLP58923.1 hypothetical protein BJF93_23135 [Xaviernesmea oryzae]SEM01747.1 Uncharacterized conserved protein, DUF736 family [Xaviernesmea oryzae]